MMPTSSEAYTGRYKSQPMPKQNYNRAPHQSVSVNVNKLNGIPSTSVGTGSSKMIWIIGSLITLTFLAVGGGVGAALALTQKQSSSTNVANSSAIITNGSNNSNLTTLGTTSISSGTSTAVSSSTSTSTVSTTSTSSVSATTTLAAGFSAGGAVLSTTTAWYGYEEVTINCTTNLNNITIIIIVQKTVNATYSGAFSTFWSGTMNQGYLDIGTQIIYTWTIISGQIIQCSGSPYRAQAQFSLHGTNQITTADTYQVIATTVGGVTSSFSGHF